MTPQRRVPRSGAARRAGYGPLTTRGSLIEREPELGRRIDAALMSARDGNGATVLIEAEAGIGKTSLLEEACARAEAAAMTVLSARGSSIEGDYALGVGIERLAIAVEGALPFGPMRVKLVVDVSAIRSEGI